MFYFERDRVEIPHDLRGQILFAVLGRQDGTRVAFHAPTFSSRLELNTSVQEPSMMRQWSGLATRRRSKSDSVSLSCVYMARLYHHHVEHGVTTGRH